MASSTEEIAPELDRAMARLSEVDRAAITLRYLQGKSTGETAKCLGISESAAEKRIYRGVDHLRKILLRRHAIAPTVAVAVVLDQIPRLSAPTALANSAVTAATIGSASAAHIAIAQGVLHMMMIHKLIAALLLLAVLAGITEIGVEAVKLLADQNVRAAVSPATAPMVPATNPDQVPEFAASLSNGVGIEIVGISESPSFEKQWWLANGNPLDTPPYDSDPKFQVAPSKGFLTREFAVQTYDAVHGSVDPATVGWVVTSANDWCQTSVNDEVGTRIPGMNKLAGTVPDAPGGATVHATIAAGKWQTICSAGADGCSVQDIPGGPKLAVISHPYSIADETHVVVVCDGLTNHDIRLVAIDRAGNLIPTRNVTGSGFGANLAEERAVQKPLKSIRGWQLQARPVDQWIEIHGISLNAGQKTKVTVLTSDDRKNP